MGLFDKIKDNAKEISVRAIEETDADYNAQAAGSTVTPSPSYPDDTLASTPPDDNAAQPIDDQYYDSPTPEELSDQIVHELESESSDVEPEPDQYEPEPQAEPEPESESESVPEERVDEPKDLKKKPEAATHKVTVKKEEKTENKSESAKQVSKPYTPSYKQPRSGMGKTGKVPRVIDISPQHRVQESDKRVLYERERAIMATLASQRRLDGTTPLYITTHLRFKTRVFIDRIEYSGSFGKNVIPIEQVSWIKLRAGGTGVIIESTAGKRIVMVIKPADRLSFAEAVLKVQSMQPKKIKFKDTKTVRLDQLEKLEEGIDEIEKLARLLDKGILTQEEFDAKKKQILGI